MRVLLIALLLSGCAAWEKAMEPMPPPPPGYTRYYDPYSGWHYLKQLGPTSQGSFTEPKRH